MMLTLPRGEVSLIASRWLGHVSQLQHAVSGDGQASVAQDAESVDGGSRLAHQALAFTVGWILLFYLISWTQPVWMRHVPHSPKAHENDRYWCARNMFGIVHATFVAALSVPAVIALLPAGRHVRFASSHHLAHCGLDSLDVDLVAWNGVAQAIALGALAVTTFMAADLVILVVHKQWTIDYLLHHVAFIIGGSILRCRCMLPFNGAVLLAMEVSTPFLNYLLLYRNRGDTYKLSTSISGAAFFVLFILFRVFLNLYATVLLWFEGRAAVPGRVPEWQLITVLAALTAGALVQLYWLPGILRTFLAACAELRQPGTDAGESLAAKKNWSEIEAAGDTCDEQRGVPQDERLPGAKSWRQGAQ